MSLLKQFYVDPLLHIKWLASSVLVSFSLGMALYAARPPEFFEFHFQPWHVLLVPLGIYLGGLSVIVIHNATHNQFPGRKLNRLCGHVAGMQQLWGFMGWKLIHVLHHQYTDDADRDIHSPKGVTFWGYVRKMMYAPPQVIEQRYIEHFGKTAKSQLILRGAFSSFLLLVACNLWFWTMLLGPEGMLFFFLPSYLMNYFLFAHLNYYGHPVDSATNETQPVNLNEGWYFKLANRLWFGIYFHENHHRKPQIFNPRHVVPNTKQ